MMGKYLALLRNTDAAAPVESDPKSIIPAPEPRLDSGGAAPEAVTPIGGTSPAQPRREMEAVPFSLLLVDIADAIASAPRSPFLNDLAIARTARALVEVERTIVDAPPSIRIEVASVARNAAKLVADAIRAKRYGSAYDLLDNLTARMRELQVH
jgi:hypothetical protein